MTTATTKPTAPMSTYDLMSIIFAFTGISIVALILGSLGRDQARKSDRKQHPVGMVGFIFGGIGTAFWCLLLYTACAGMASTTTHTATASAPTVSTRQATASMPTATTIPGSGTFMVGSEITPGTYRTSGAVEQAFTFCSFSRLRDLSGSSSATISWGTASANDPQIMTIAVGDAAFKTSGCSDWVKIK